MKKVLLPLAALGLATAAQAQLLNYGFETSDILPGELQEVNWDAYAEGSTYNLKATPAYAGEYALSVTTDATANRWERVVAFKNIGLKENTSYRVSFFVQGTGTINVALMKGDWNADMPLIGGFGEEYVSQYHDATPTDASAYKKVSFVFWAPSNEIQHQFFPSFNSDTTLVDGDFLRLAFTGIGNYLVDNVVVEEASIKGVSFNGDVVAVDFGYATNAAALASSNGGTYVLDASAVKVVLNGEEVTPESVELKTDGRMYIFLGEENWLSEESEISISFTNPGALTYSTNVAPESWTNPNAAVYGFEAEAGIFDENLTATSYAYEEARLLSSVPANESFELDNDITTFSFTFNRPVFSNAPENGKPTAVLTGGNLTEELIVTEFEGVQQTLTFTRPNTDPLPKGTYTVTLDNVSNEKDVATTSPFVITIEVGKVVVSETTYTEILEVTFPEAEVNTVPAGWIINNEGEIRKADGTVFGSGPRVFAWTNSTVSRAFMFRTTAAENVGTATYGEDENYPLVIPAGDVELRAILGAWDAGGFNVEVSIIDADDASVVVSEKFIMSTVLQGRENLVFQQEKLRFTSDGGKYIFKAQVLGDGGFDQAVCGGLKVYTYVETAGETSESQVVFRDDFNSYTNNTAPTTESGWAAYLDGNPRNPGGDYNYNGDRIWTGIGAKNLPAGYYSNGAYGQSATDPTHYIIYGENEGVEPLKLNNQKYQFTYYGVAWKATPQYLYFQLINADGKVEYSRMDTLTSNLNGVRTTSIDANKIQFTYTPAGGNYKLKAWTAGEAIFGNFKIETVGSLAVQYKNLLKDALADAQKELETAEADAAFAGTTQDALAAAIKTYTNPDFHTVKEYTDAIAELDKLVKAMAARRANVTSYASALTNLSDLIAKINTEVQPESGETDMSRFKALDAYTEGTELVAEYGEVSSASLDDATLASAVTRINNTYSLLKNLVETGVGLLTKQIEALANEVSTIAGAGENEVVLAAFQAITDDQAIAGVLKKYAIAAIYQTIAGGYNFTIFDEEYQQNYPDSLDASNFIQNRGFYCLAQSYDATPEDYPGWNISLGGSTSMKAGWDKGWDPYAGSATNPVVDARVKNTWGDGEIIVSQELVLPVGIYSYKMGMCDRSFSTYADGVNTFSEPTRSRVFYVAGEKSDSVAADLSTMGQYYNESTTLVKNVPVEQDGNYGKLTIGASLRTVASFGFIDNAALFMTAPVAGFDYAAAAAAVLADANEATTGIDAAEIVGEPIEVQFYNLAGQRIAEAQGICLKVERHANGAMVVKKVFVK